MNHSLQQIREVMLIEGLCCIGFGALLLLLTRWRSHYLRWLGIRKPLCRPPVPTGRWAESLRHFEESRTFVKIVAALLAVHVLLCLFAAGAYIFFSARAREKQSPHGSLAAAGHQGVGNPLEDALAEKSSHQWSC